MGPRRADEGLTVETSDMRSEHVMSEGANGTDIEQVNSRYALFAPQLANDPFEMNR
jgi:hypothetical protein